VWTFLRPRSFQRETVLAFAVCGAIWGSTFLVISIDNDTLAAVSARLRLLIAASLLIAWTFARRASPCLGARRWHTAFVLFWSFFAIARKLLVSRSQRDSVGCYTPASLDSACALTAFGPSIRRAIRALNASLYDIVSSSFLCPRPVIGAGPSGPQLRAALPCHTGISLTPSALGSWVKQARRAYQGEPG
jgi:hypothetical protein